MDKILDKFYDTLREKINTGELSPWNGVQRASVNIFAKWLEINYELFKIEYPEEEGRERE